MRAVDAVQGVLRMFQGGDFRCGLQRMTQRAVGVRPVEVVVVLDAQIAVGIQKSGMGEVVITVEDPRRHSSASVGLRQILAGIEYFDLWIYEEPGNAGTDDIVPTQPVQPIDDSEIVPPVFEGRLYRDGYLRVENLDPGKYYIEARAGGDPDICEFVSVVVQGSNMDEYGNIIVERGVPVLIKLLVSYDRH